MHNDFIELQTEFGVSYISKKAILDRGTISTILDRGTISTKAGFGSVIILNGKEYTTDKTPTEVMDLLKDNQLNG